MMLPHTTRQAAGTSAHRFANSSGGGAGASGPATGAATKIPVQPAPSAEDGQPQTEWVLQRARVTSAGLRLVQHEIDEIGISLKHGWITPERAADDLAALERLPLHIASMFYFGGGGS